MFTVESNARCCDCTKGNKAVSITTIYEPVEDYLEMTEYNFGRLLDVWEIGSGYCHFCESLNVYDENIKINNKKLYDFDFVVENLKNSDGNEDFLIFNFVKEEYKTKVKVGGKSKVSEIFFLNCWNILFQAIEEIPIHRFVDNRNGTFEIAVIGNYDSIKILRLKMFGFEKFELTKEINEYFGNKAFNI
jgi:hypothetical protein